MSVASEAKLAQLETRVILQGERVTELERKVAWLEQEISTRKSESKRVNGAR